MSDWRRSLSVILAFTKLCASRSQKDFTLLTARSLSEEYGVCSFAMPRVLICLHSPLPRCSC
jgi:hypothetical protein